MRPIVCTAIIALPLLALVACSGLEMKPGDKARNTREIREGPGMLTGSDGEFVIFRVDKPAQAGEESPEDDSGWKDLADPEAAEKEEEAPLP